MGSIIEVVNIRKVYKDDITALDGVGFSINNRGIYMLVGPNGAGKTTLIRILATIIRPTEGEAYILGYSVRDEPKKVREIVSLVPQEGSPDPYLTPWEHVYYYLKARGISEGDALQLAKDALETVGLYDMRNRLIARLSGGQRRRVLIATALAVPAEVYFLDEPTIGLDPMARREVWKVLRERSHGSLLFITTHYMEEAEELGREVLLISKGRIIAKGTPQELVSRLGYMFKVVIASSRAGLDRVPRDLHVVCEDECVVYVKDQIELFEVIRELVSNGITDFIVKKVSLEDVFINIIKVDKR